MAFRSGLAGLLRGCLASGQLDDGGLALRRFRPLLERLEERSLLSAGAPDPTFGTMGIASTQFISGDTNRGDSVLVQPDGKAVLAGTVDGNVPSEAGLARFKADGTPDTAFGTSGQVLTGFTTTNGFNPPCTALLQADGKIVVVTSFGTTTFSDIGLARYKSDGTLDSGFGQSGKVDTSFGQGFFVLEVTDAVLQPDGKIVVVATLNGFFSLLRYNVDGSLDSSFGDSGVVSIPFGDRLALQRDGRLVVVANNAVARYNPDGSLDSTFGAGGTITTGLGHNKLFGGTDVALETDGKILFAGTNQADQLVMLRFNVNGNVDATFGTGGTAVFAGFQSPSALAIEGSGRILVSGGAAFNETPFLIRLDPDGLLDASFAGNGSSPLGMPMDLALQPDGKILLAGTGANSSAAVARLLTDNPLPTSNQRFVAQVYLDLLDRTVDSTGLNYWMSLLDQSQATRDQVVQAIQASAEYQAIEVQGLFGLLLNRAASADDVRNYSGFLATGGTPGTDAGTAGRLGGILPRSWRYERRLPGRSLPRRLRPSCRSDGPAELRCGTHERRSFPFASRRRDFHQRGVFHQFD
jgi:uncharacterized delta-60 repeat protein